ncbi:MAG: ribosomal-processing cysteine protease Prp [Bacilli bacterium]|jgi:uncharacterized protein YsxB (DUF464 family)|nr:ribosomal-processing cysteine protease Prp [Bacilli bacterium]MCH4228304.1 ribosomal-processing cysteine protease Prp [Bacilli bacterium]MCH4277347.1 ribosomal-processing cysteine protease Prp [Bacilli bacterium]MCI2054725.1 ribosomal-processing cysteine protease Prp [Bacilli bacterium]
MIKITLKSQNGEFVSLEAKGHAGSGPYGHDLVCAAISAVILGGLNALKDDESSYSVKVEEGHTLLERNKTLSEHDTIVIETIVKQIESIAESHPDNVKLERK